MLLLHKVIHVLIKKLLNDIWLGLKKNKDASYKPINVTEDELNNYIEKLPITHYCHCCRKRNLYQKYRNTIKKQKKTSTSLSLQQSTI